tara:strand:+ start:765 stop:959 length:195 start_codon:yes stop_codon:yes gene_type:complete
MSSNVDKIIDTYFDSLKKIIKKNIKTKDFNSDTIEVTNDEDIVLKVENKNIGIKIDIKLNIYEK